MLTVITMIMLGTPTEIPVFEPTEATAYSQADTVITASFGPEGKPREWESRRYDKNHYGGIVSQYNLTYQVINGRKVAVMQLTFAPANMDSQAAQKVGRMGTRFMIFDFKGVGRYAIEQDKAVWSDEQYRPGTTEPSIKRHITLIRNNFAAYGSNAQSAMSTGLGVDSKEKIGGWIEIEGINTDGAIRGKFSFTAGDDICPNGKPCWIRIARVEGNFVSDVNRLRTQSVAVLPDGEKVDVGVKPKPRLATPPGIKPRIKSPATGATAPGGGQYGNIMDRIAKIPQANARYADCPAPTGSACENSNETYYKYRSCHSSSDGDHGKCAGLFQAHERAAKACLAAYERSGC
ncbi:MAG: hypothetical protein R3217_06935 [Gammaproteobacteria bacterium]|nr:hypothetical protein [Gammaproteobacteria bacterium]